MDEKVAKLTEKERDVEEGINKAKQAQSFIETIDGKFEGLRNEFGYYSGLKDKIDKDIRAIESRMESLGATDEKIDNIISRFSQMDTFVADIEKRMEQLDIARRRLAESERKMQTLQESADDKITRLNNLVGTSVVEAGNPGRSKPSRTPAKTQMATATATKRQNNDENIIRGVGKENRRESVIKLYERGFDTDRIATLLDMSTSEVRLILDFDKK